MWSQSRQDMEQVTEQRKLRPQQEGRSSWSAVRSPSLKPVLRIFSSHHQEADSVRLVGLPHPGGPHHSTKFSSPLRNSILC